MENRIKALENKVAALEARIKSLESHPNPGGPHMPSATIVKSTAGMSKGVKGMTGSISTGRKI